MSDSWRTLGIFVLPRKIDVRDEPRAENFTVDIFFHYISDSDISSVLARMPGMLAGKRLPSFADIRELHLVMSDPLVSTSVSLDLSLFPIPHTLTIQNCME